MPKTKAQGREKWMLLDAPPADPEAVSLATDLAGALDISCAIAASDSRISAAASETFTDPAVCDEIAVTDFGASNYEGTVAPFRFFTTDGASEPGTTPNVYDSAYQALSEKGTEVYILIRETSKLSTEPLEAADEYEIYHVATDTPQRPSSREGYQKRIVPLSIRGAWKGVIAA